MNNKFHVQKMLLLLLLFIPLVGICQTKNVISYTRAFPKVDKLPEFERALAAHAQKYHTGDVRWRVFAIQSGQDFGGFHITEGPTSWDAEDARGDLGKEHTNDWNKNVAIYLTDRTSGGYSVYVDSLSTIALGDYSDKIQISHWYPKVGWNNKTASLIQGLKTSWKAEGSTVAVYTGNGSGPAQYLLVTRYKQGLKEKTNGYRKPFVDTYEALNGGGSYENYLSNLRMYVNEIWSEILFYRADLSSK